MSEEAWVSLATNDSYCLGALVLGTSLKRVGTTRKLALMISPSVSPQMREILQTVFDVIEEVYPIDSKDDVNLALLTRPELGITFTKIHCWKLTQFTKCVFLDADTLVLQNCDELFDREELSACTDVGWPDCFNSGVFVYVPSNETFNNIAKLALSQGSFDGGDQGLLNLYFNDWSQSDIRKHLPFIYNMTATSSYTYLPAFKAFGDNVKIVHFIGPVKPWFQYYDSSTGRVVASSSHIEKLLQPWWDIFRSDVYPKLMRPTRVVEANATEVEAEDFAATLEISSFVQTWVDESSHSPQTPFEEAFQTHLSVAIVRHPPEITIYDRPHFQHFPSHSESHQNPHYQSHHTESQSHNHPTPQSNNMNNLKEEQKPVETQPVENYQKSENLLDEIRKNHELHISSYKRRKEENSYSGSDWKEEMKFVNPSVCSYSECGDVSGMNRRIFFY